MSFGEKNENVRVTKEINNSIMDIEIIIRVPKHALYRMSVCNSMRSNMLYYFTLTVDMRS